MSIRIILLSNPDGVGAYQGPTTNTTRKGIAG